MCNIVKVSSLALPDYFLLCNTTCILMYTLKPNDMDWRSSLATTLYQTTAAHWLDYVANYQERVFFP